MWTPRRIFLLLFGLTLCVGGYFTYSRFLGGIDGLPELPSPLVTPITDPLPPNLDTVSATERLLRNIFGPDSPEVKDQEYNLKLELRNKGIVFACGQPQFTEKSRFVKVSPFSIALLGKPKAQHLLLPGEAQEVSTFHADRAILEYDTEVASLQDMTGKAKMIGMELLSDPELLSFDPRRGMIEVTNNQKDIDANHKLVFRTRGPLFYLAPKPDAKKSNDEVHVWTNAPVEIVDRKNLPQPLRRVRTDTAATSGDELRKRDAIADILSGETLPPPTITAVGMKIYFAQEDAGPAGPQGEKRTSSGYSGVRLVELPEKVQFNLWSGGGAAGFPGSSAEPTVRKLLPDPPTSLAAVSGGVTDALSLADRYGDKTLLVIETPGPFRYDFPAGFATFDAAAVTDPTVSNHVTAARLSANGKQDYLVCKHLKADFVTPEKIDPKAPPAPKPPTPTTAGGMKIKAITATGPHVYVSVESEQLEAQGTELVYTTDAKTRKTVTTLRGDPVIATRNNNNMQAGVPGQRAEIVITSIAAEPPPKTPPPPGQPPKPLERKKTDVVVNGPGRVDLHDETAKAKTLRAEWGQSLRHTKELVGKVEQDVLFFEGGGRFVDLKGNMDLSARRLVLWLAADEAKPGDDKTTAKPQKLLAIDDVNGHSADWIIEKTDQLTTLFRDVPPPPPEPKKEVAPAPMPTIPMPPPIKPDVVAKAPEKPKDPEKPKPTHISARVIQTWVVRYPQVVPPAKPPAPGEPPAKEQITLKYELEKALCEDRVVVHQDPADPKKSPRGMDISGVRLNLENYFASRSGSVMTVHGTLREPAQVHYEAMSLFGPIVVIDQPNNAASVAGVGRLIMPANDDTQPGAAAPKPNELDIQWTISMNFQGAKSYAEFLGQVQATQRPSKTAVPKGPELAPIPRTVPILYQIGAAPPKKTPEPIDDGSWDEKVVLCHRLDVTFDRPIYFNEMKRDEKRAEVRKDSGKDTGSAKLKKAVCTPMPDDEAAKLPGKVMKQVVYLDRTFTKAGKVSRAQRIDSLQLDVVNEEREQRVYATGPGEVRILQMGSKDNFSTPAAPPPPVPGQPAPAPKPPEQEMKLTLVKFISRMVAEDKAGEFRKAVFDDGARVWNLPSDDLNKPFDQHNPPPRTTVLSCSESLTVSSAKKKDAPDEQWMVAKGSGEFQTDDYLGFAATIRYEGAAVILDGSAKQFAKLYPRRNPRDHTSARQIIYYRDGTIRTNDSASGAITTGK